MNTPLKELKKWTDMYKPTYGVSIEQHPKWYHFRLRLSCLLVKWANKIYPENPAVMGFMTKQATDLLIYGQAITHIDVPDYYKEATCQTY